MEEPAHVRTRIARARRATPESDTGLHEEAANDAADGLIARLGRLWERGRLPSESEVRRLFEARLTDVAANKLARRWVELYTAAAGKERRLMLSALAQVRATYAGDGGEGVRFFKRLNAQSQGLRFLVDLRADMLRWRKQVADLQGLDKELEGLLSAWFDVGLLELRPLTWDSPASLLEKLILYEAVHEITSWDDLRHRVAPDRRCYAYFHPQMPGVPLIFVEVAFAGQMAGNVRGAAGQLRAAAGPGQGALGDLLFHLQHAARPERHQLRQFPAQARGRAVAAGIAQAQVLRHAVADPRFLGLAGQAGRQGGAGHPARWQGRERDGGHDGQRWVAHLSRAAAGKAPEALRRAGFRLAAHYLQSMKNGAPLDAVARFHLATALASSA